MTQYICLDSLDAGDVDTGYASVLRRNDGSFYMLTYHGANVAGPSSVDKVLFGVG